MTVRALDLIPLHSLFVSGRADEQATCHDGQRLVLWGEFAGRVAAVANRLKLRTESRWLLAGDDPQCFAIKLFALLCAGKQVVIPPNTQAGTLTMLADVFDAQLRDEEIEVALAENNLAALDPHETVIDLYTSGSTGEAKRVRKTLAQFEAEIEVLESLWGALLGSSAIVATAPHQHIYGLLFRLLWPLAAGRVFDAVTCAHPDTLEERLTVLGEAALVSSPAQLARLPELVPLAAFGPKLRAVFSSGGALPATAAKAFFQQLGLAPIEVFGSTESGGIAWRRQTGGEGAELWTPFPGIDVGCSESSALFLRSPFLGSEPCREMDDSIELMPDGRFRLLGRLDRIVKIEEKRLSLPDMESHLNAHAWVGVSAVVPLAGRRQTLGAVLVLTDEGRQQLALQGRRSLVQAVRKHLAEHYEPVLLPRHWRFPDQLPINERGKVSRAALTALFAVDGDVVLYPEVLHAHHKPDGSSQIVLDLHVTPLISHFSGHFPGLSVLPGIVQIDWAIHFARQYYTLDGRFSALEKIKFMGLVLPDVKLQLTFRWDAGTRSLDFLYLTRQRKYSSGRIVFGGAQ